MKILLVEDDVRMADYMADGLTRHGHVVDVARTGRDGLFLSVSGSYDLLIVDRMLPEMDGLVLVKVARGAGLARRPPLSVQSTTLKVADLEMDCAKRTVARGGVPILLQPREFRLLEFLVRALATGYLMLPPDK